MKRQAGRLCGLFGVLLAHHALGVSSTVVTIDPSQHFQTMVGFGGTLTDSGAAALSVLSQPAQSALMASLFSSTGGAGLSFIRTQMGASDFRLADYTYDEVPHGQSDSSLSNFSISHDTTNYSGTITSMVSLLQQASVLNSRLSVMGSPWTAPAWMKTGTATNIVAQTGVNQYLYGGTLSGAESAANPVYQSYAQYFVKYVQAYAAQGIKIAYVTPQNEPSFNGGYAYASMTLDTTQQAALIQDIGQAFATSLVNPGAGFNAVTNPFISAGTRIDILDDNWNQAVTTNGSNTTVSANLTGIMNSAAAPYVSGVAFHGYGGDVSAQNVVHSAYPNLRLDFTEQTGSVETTGTVQQNFANDLMYDMQNLVVGGTRDWASTISKFNLALNESSGPKITTVTFDNGGGNFQTANSGDDNGRGIVTVNSQTGAITRNEEYYALGQIARFVQPNAVRIASDSTQSVAFLNPDNTTALVAYNNASVAESFQFQDGAYYFSYTIPTDSVVTFTWSADSFNAPVQVYETTGDMSKLLAQQAPITMVPEPGCEALLLAATTLVMTRRPPRSV